MGGSLGGTSAASNYDTTPLIASACWRAGTSTHSRAMADREASSTNRTLAHASPLSPILSVPVLRLVDAVIFLFGAGQCGYGKVAFSTLIHALVVGSPWTTGHRRDGDWFVASSSNTSPRSISSYTLESSVDERLE